MDVINKRTTIFQSAIKKETQAFLSFVGYWRICIPVSLWDLSHSLVTQNKSYFKWDPRQKKRYWTGQIVESLCSSPSPYSTSHEEHSLHHSWGAWPRPGPVAENTQRLKIDLQEFGAGDIKDPRPPSSWLQKRYLEHVGELKLLQEQLLWKHRPSGHCDCLSCAGCSKEGSLLCVYPN